jgi:hypothetical protein
MSGWFEFLGCSGPVAIPGSLVKGIIASPVPRKCKVKLL